MANYTKSTNFAVKDTLTTGDPQKIVSGVEIDTEFVNISSMSSTKIDKVGGATAGNIATLTAGGSVQDSGESLTAVQQSITDAAYDSDDLKTDLSANGDAPIYAARAWASVTRTGVVNASANVDSVTKVGTGNFKVTFSTDIEDANYAVLVTAIGDDEYASIKPFTVAADSFEVYTTDESSSAISDEPFFAAVFR